MGSDRSHSSEEVVRCCELIPSGITAPVEPAHMAQLLVIDIESSDSDIDEEAGAATQPIAARHPNGSHRLVNGLNSWSETTIRMRGATR
jgi:hypothetical protein